jgi:AcrR family transcriptional regulator
MNTEANTPPKKSFKIQMLAARETAIIQSVNRLLAEKGFDAMTVDEVAAEVGIAKASLYKHFTSKDLMDGLMEVSDALGGWIEEAQAQGQINKALPAVAVLYTLFARACDPVLEFLKMGEQHTDEQILDLVMSTCFDGLSAR